jgi:hypothetical protein
VAHKSFLLLVASCMASACLAAEPAKAPELSAERIKAAVKYLASDRLTGRAPGTAHRRGCMECGAKEAGDVRPGSDVATAARPGYVSGMR